MLPLPHRPKRCALLIELHSDMAPSVGIEPTSFPLTAGRSTDELTRIILAEIGGFEPLSNAVTGHRADR